MIIVRCLAPILFAACAAATTAQEPLPWSSGQTLYLPIYSDLWHGDLGSRSLPDRTPLSAPVSIRNTDPAHADLRNPRTVSFITVARPIRPAE